MIPVTEAAVDCASFLSKYGKMLNECSTDCSLKIKFYTTARFGCVPQMNIQI